MTQRSCTIDGIEVSTSDDDSRVCCKSGSCNKLNTYDWLKDIPQLPNSSEIIEIRFKNTRKTFYYNVNGLPLKRGDIVAVEASPGHDIGIVSLTGELVREQLKRYGLKEKAADLKKVYRKAKQNDLEKWYDAISREEETMLKARVIADDLKLDMKISDVEYQGDKTKAIFYYIANERVDFRGLIKVLADEFRIRIEMRQIGARQEAGRVGGIGSCGRELCCSTFITNFVSVTTNAARHQEISLNPQKLAGQCGKLKCCLNYELSAYLDAREDFPDTNIPLKTENGEAYHFKSDIHRKMLWYSFHKEYPENVTAVSVSRAHEVIKLNREGKKTARLTDETFVAETKPLEFENQMGQDSLTRFDDKNPRKKKKKKRRNQHKRKPKNNNDQ